MRPIDPRYDNRRGDKSVRAKLTEADVLAIRAVKPALDMRKRRWRREFTGSVPTVLELATKYGVTGSTIVAVVQRKTWRHL